MARGFTSSGIVAGRTRRSHRDQKSEHLKSNKVTMGIGVPRQAEGTVGDITVRDVSSVGKICYIKTDGGWVDINSMQSAFEVKWHPFVFSNNWEAYSDATTPKYFKDQNGFVHFKGAIKNDSTYNATFTTLPEGFRPTRQVYVAAYKTGDGNVAIGITSSGVCSFNTGTAKSQEYLDGISFFTGQTIKGSGGGSSGGGGGGTGSGGSGGTG